MDLSTREYAERRGVSVALVHKLIRQQKIEARKIGSSWAIPESQLLRRAPVSRPLSRQNAWALIALLSGADPSGLDQTAAWRLRRKHARVLTESEPASLLSSWLSSRALVLKLAANPTDLHGLRDDPRIVLSGISEGRAGLSSSHEVEAYVAPEAAESLMSDYLLIPADRPNVWLHLAEVQPDDRGRAPLGLVIADLADHGGPREESRLRELLASS